MFSFRIRLEAGGNIPRPLHEAPNDLERENRANTHHERIRILETRVRAYPDDQYWESALARLSQISSLGQAELHILVSVKQREMVS